MIELSKLLFVEDVRVKFNLKTLDQLVNSKQFEQAETYCKKTLMFLGVGSSRMVFKISSKKVLKLPYGNMFEAGIEQNLTENKVATELPNLVTKVFQFHPKGYYLVSEIAKAFKDESSREELNNWFGFPISEYYKISNPRLEQQRLEQQAEVKILEVLRTLPNKKQFNKLFSLLETYRGKKHYVSLTVDQWFKREKLQPEFYPEQPVVTALDDSFNSLRWFQNHKISPILNTPQARELITAILSKKLNVSDLLKINSWGKTADGRIVLLDSGLDEPVYAKFYSDLD